MDLEVYTIKNEEKLPKIHELTIEHRIKLLELLQMKIYINNEFTSILNSSSILVNSLVNCTKENDITLIKLPRFDNGKI